MAGILAGALGGVADAAQGMARGYIDDERKLSVAEQMSAIEEKRQLRISEAAELRRRSGRQADFEQDAGNADRKREIEVADRRATGAVDNDTAVDRKQREGVIAAQQAQDANLAGATPAQLAATRAQAQAKAVFSPAAYAEAEVAKMNVEDRKRHRALVDQWEKVSNQTDLTPDQKAAKQAAIQKQIELNVQRAGPAKTNPDMDTETVVTEAMDDAGNTTKTTRTQKRQPKPGASTPKPAGPVVPPQAAIDMLKSNPALKAQFDAKYGAGAAATALGRRQSGIVN